MQWNSLLKLAGYKKVGASYRNPKTGRLVTRASALNRAASDLGYKNYAEAKEAYKSIAYKRFVAFAKNSGVPTDADFQKLFADAWNDRSKKTRAGKPAKSHKLTKLLKHVGKLPKSFRNPYGNPL